MIKVSCENVIINPESAMEHKGYKIKISCDIRWENINMPPVIIYTAEADRVKFGPVSNVDLIDVLDEIKYEIDRI